MNHFPRSSGSMHTLKPFSLWKYSLQKCVFLSDGFTKSLLSPNNKATVQTLCSVELQLALIGINERGHYLAAKTHPYCMQERKLVSQGSVSHRKDT